MKDYIKFMLSQKIFILYISLALLFLFSCLIIQNFYKLWKKRQEGLIGSKLHIQFIFIFASMIIVPTFFLSAFFVFFINVGVQSWFGKPVQKALDQAEHIAKAYLKEHQESIKIDIHALIQFLKPQIQSFLNHPDELSQILSGLADERGLCEIIIFNARGIIIAESYLSFALMFDSSLVHLIDKGLGNLEKGPIILLNDKKRVRSIALLDSVTNTYIFVGKIISDEVIEHTQNTKKAIFEFKQLSKQHENLLIIFFFFLASIVVLLLFLAIFISIKISYKIVTPIRSLIEAAHLVSQGNLNIKLQMPILNNEFDALSESFNNMTTQLRRQKRDLALSQRHLAWSDVAQRIAHEIKNPLTPIQLAAERLKRRYKKEIQTDVAVFETCIETIIRQVDNIGCLVREFSAFARMPDPVIESIDINKVAFQAIFLQKEAHPFIKFTLSHNENPIIWPFDSKQLHRVFTNLFQNAIHASLEDISFNRKMIEIHVDVEINKDTLQISISDNGPGFSLTKKRDSLLDPYVTTRHKGTGLGLSIVRRIVMDHNGQVELYNKNELPPFPQDKGAIVRLLFSTQQNLKYVS